MTPSPEFQIEFLQGIQRILKEGVFTSTYKFALIHSIADCCIEKGTDDNSRLELNTLQLAEKFIDLYWPQSSIFPNGCKTEILFQNSDRQAAIISHIAKVREFSPNLNIIKSDNKYLLLKNRVSKVIQDMPLWKLQIVGNHVFDFLYPQLGTGNLILLNPGIGYCFRKFYGEVTDMLHSAWIRWIQKVSKNKSILGQNVNLESFLFDSKRSNLSAFVPILQNDQNNQCFYCEKEIRRDPEVDHFIPWSKYSVDLGHNFVLAHKSCNGEKKDFLASIPFYEKWLYRNKTSSNVLSNTFDQHHLYHDLDASTAIAAWAYKQCRINRNQVWLGYKAGFTII